MSSAPVSLTTPAPRKVEAFNILVATAGDDESTGAVRAASLLARRMGGDVEVLTVVTPFPSALPTGLMMATAAEADEESRKMAIERVHAQLKDIRGAARWPVHAAVGWPVDSIVEAARRWHASLVVMGIGEHSAKARLFGSETAIGVAKHTGTPILAIPAGFMRAPMNAFAAIDFTPSSIDAARLAARLMPPTGSVTLIHASIFAKPSTEVGSVMDLYATGARDRLAAIAEQLTHETHRRVKTLLADDKVANVLMSVADGQKADLIALGSQERGLIDRVLLGSVRTRVLRNTVCPVLIVPHVETAE
jgi:nucleotide-binding universal stress UspA family protein